MRGALAKIEIVYKTILAQMKVTGRRVVCCTAIEIRTLQLSVSREE